MTHLLRLHTGVRYITVNRILALINTIYSNDVTLVVLQKMYVLLDTLAKVWFIYIEPVRLLSDLNYVSSKTACNTIVS